MSSNTRTVRPSDLKTLVKSMIRAKRPVFLWGPPGIGKSDLIAAIGAETNRPVIDLRLALMEPTDLRGLPYFNHDEKTMVWAPPSELPRADDETKNAILFLDELNSAPPSVQAAAYQLVLNRRIGNYFLPKDVVIVAAGNRETDKGVTYRMPAPLANRFLHLEVEANFEDWQNWAVDANVHPDVIGYLSANKSCLFKFDPKSPSKAFATPRSWHFVSDIVQEGTMSEKLLGVAVSGAVGDGQATEFMQHRRIAAKMPQPADILSGKVTKLAVNEISAKYSIIISLCYELKDHSKRNTDNAEDAIGAVKFHEYLDNFFAFLMNNMETEICILGASTLMHNFKVPFDIRKLKNFDKFCKEYKEFIIPS